jgi:single-strand selective monofunctional uracil DNA glycosylase
MSSSRSRSPQPVGDQLVAIADRLAGAVEALRFAGKVAHVYNPLRYARGAHAQFLQRYARRGASLLVGMNPGPWGMMQTGVPFGEVGVVRDWLAIDGAIKRPAHEHPMRPILGYDCRRSEVSGARLWGWARDRFDTPEAFFSRFFVWNYCPLAFLVASGANLTPDKLPQAEREPLYAACDVALAEVAALLEPPLVIGIGAFAEARARSALAARELPVATVLHPSPASPRANRGWALQVEAQLRALGAL